MRKLQTLNDFKKFNDIKYNPELLLNKFIIYYIGINGKFVIYYIYKIKNITNDRCYVNIISKDIQSADYITCINFEESMQDNKTIYIL